MSYAVIGLGFGDEGKGKVVDYLAKKNEISYVVRYSGGQQAGHTVYYNDHNHVFSNFGSGTFRGASTYWDKNCTIDLYGMFKEYDILKEKGFNPKLYINRLCPVTTVFDKCWQIEDKNNLKHGTVGVGVGSTFQREADHYSLVFEDLFNLTVLKIKLDLIEKYYDNKYGGSMGCGIVPFYHLVERLYREDDINIFEGNYPMLNNKVGIYESSQGLLLDQNIGFFPHVTRSSVGTENLPQYTQIWLVTRAYQTRHGNGPMTEYHANLGINKYESNKDDGYQGKFRRSVLDLDLIKYGMNKDKRIRDGGSSLNLVVTCLDHIKDYMFVLGGRSHIFKDEKEFIKAIAKELNISSMYVSHSPYSDSIKKVDYV